MEPSAAMECHTEVGEDVTATPAIPVVDVDRSFAELYTARFDGLVRLAALLVGSTAAAEDIVQDCFAKLFDKVSQVDVPEAWLRVAVVTACRNERRRLGVARKFQPRLAARVATDDPPVDELIASLRRLTSRQRAVVVLRFYLDLPEAEIATLLGMRVGTVKSTLHRALGRLRVEVER
jgi:RNA polymerase sigma factor (sigma-70 family)